MKVVRSTEGSEDESHGHSKKEQIEHALHYTSLFILALFVLEVRAVKFHRFVTECTGAGNCDKNVSAVKCCTSHDGP